MVLEAVEGFFLSGAILFAAAIHAGLGANEEGVFPCLISRKNGPVVFDPLENSLVRAGMNVVTHVDLEQFGNGVLTEFNCFTSGVDAPIVDGVAPSIVVKHGVDLDIIFKKANRLAGLDIFADGIAVAGHALADVFTEASVGRKSEKGKHEGDDGLDLHFRCVGFKKTSG